MKKKSVVLSIVTIILLIMLSLTACSVQYAQVQNKEVESIEESAAETEAETQPRQPHDLGDAETAKQYFGTWYRSAWNEETYPDIYWLDLKEDGYCTFEKETRDKESDKVVEGTWDVDDRGLVHFTLGSEEGTFRLLENTSGSTNFIPVTGTDFFESKGEGSYASFVRATWYVGNVRVSQEQPEVEKATGSEDTEPEENVKLLIEVQGEGDKWFPLAAMKSDCIFQIDGKTVKYTEFIEKLSGGQVYARYALNKSNYYVVKISQISQ